jgi:hypothetical protein
MVPIENCISGPLGLNVTPGTKGGKMGKFFRMLYAIALCLGWLQPAHSTLIANGNFEDGLSEWTIFNPDSLPAGVMDVDPDGWGALSASNAFFVQTGGGFESSDVSMFQRAMIIDDGLYTISANIAASYFPNDTRFTNNLSAGVISVAWDGVIIDRFDFGEISANSWEYATLNASFEANTSGILEFNFFRPFASDTNSPTNYLSNVSLTFNNDMVASVPEPATALLVGIGIAGIAGFAHRRRSKPYLAS